MPTYVVLMKFTEQGVKDIKNTPERLEKNIKAMESIGGKLIGYYATMGEYDAVAIAEGPNDEIAMTFLLGLGVQGNVKTTTLRAFTKEELAEMVKKLP